MTFDSPSYTIEKKGPTGHGKEAFPWTLLSPAASPATAPPGFPGDATRPTPGAWPLKARLDQALEEAHRQGFRHFLCGMAQGADLYFCQAVLDLRQRHPEVTLEAAIPFAGQADHWSAADQRRRMTLLDQCDLETVVQHTYTPRLYEPAQPVHGGPVLPPHRRL